MCDRALYHKAIHSLSISVPLCLCGSSCSAIHDFFGSDAIASTALWRNRYLLNGYGFEIDPGIGIIKWTKVRNVKAQCYGSLSA